MQPIFKVNQLQIKNVQIFTQNIIDLQAIINSFIQINMTKKKNKKFSQLNLNVNPMRKLQKLFRYSSVRQTDFTLLYDLQREDVQKSIIDNYQVYKFAFPQGAYLIKNFLSTEEQLAVSYDCLNKFIKKPYRTNLSGEKGLYDNHSSHDQQQIIEENVKQKQQPTMNQEYTFNQKIRWSNLGYNYDWTNRKYPSTKTEVPDIIKLISNKANCIFNKIRKQQRLYNPEAIIVNYYKQRDTMTSHLDDAEEDQQSPIYSFSFGLSCVFLIGDTNKQIQPIALRLNSGDIFIMSDYSRKCYHGVPRVISSTFEMKEIPDIKLQKNEEYENNVQNVINYLKGHRININIRQVYK